MNAKAWPVVQDSPVKLVVVNEKKLCAVITFPVVEPISIKLADCDKPREIGTTKTEQSQRFVTVSDELREILLGALAGEGCPISGFVLAGERKNMPVILDNLAKRIIRPALEEAKIEWHGWYSLRRFHGTEVRMHADSETSAKALGNSKPVFEKHYLKPTAVLPDVRKAVNDAFSGLVQ